MDGNIMGIVGIFIAIVIMLAIGTQILGNTGFDCKGLEGYNLTPVWQAPRAGPQPASKSALRVKAAITSSIIIIIVVAAVGILFVVRMLQ